MVSRLGPIPPTATPSTMHVRPNEPRVYEGRQHGYSLAHATGLGLRPLLTGHYVTPSVPLMGVISEILKETRRRGSLESLPPKDKALLPALEEFQLQLGSAEGKKVRVPRLIKSAITMVSRPQTSKTFQRKATTFYSIQEILQGYGNPNEGASVELEGVVTRIKTTYGKLSGFTLQIGDSSATERNAIFVYLPKNHQHNVREGQKIKLTGYITSHHPRAFYDTSETDNNLINVQIIPFRNGIIDQGDGIMPKPIIIHKDTMNCSPYYIHPKNLKNGPVNLVEDSDIAFDIKNDAAAQLSTVKEQLVTIPDPIVIGPPSHGYIFVTSDSLIPPEARTLSGGVMMMQDGQGNPLIFPWRFRMRISSKLDIREGDRLEPLTGVVSYSDEHYNVVSADSLEIASRTQIRKFEIPNEPSLALTANVQLLGKGSEKRMREIAKSIFLDSGCPLFVGLQEFTDDSGNLNDEVVSSEEGLQTFARILQEETQHSYAFLYIDPPNNTWGGKEGSNIRNVIFYRTDIPGLKFSPSPGATANTKTTIQNIGGKAQFSHNPGLIDPENEAFKGSRKALVAQFELDGKPYYVVVIHLSSKRHDAPPFGRIQPPPTPSISIQGGQAEVITDFVKKIKAIDPDANILVIGDANADSDSPTIKKLKGGHLISADDINPEQSHGQASYNHHGGSQNLDIILLSANMLADPGFAIISEILMMHSHLPDGDPKRLSDHNPRRIRWIPKK